MKNSTFFFLILVLAAAVITGSALGVISNFDTIINAAQNQNQSNLTDADNNSSDGRTESGQDNSLVEKSAKDVVQTASVSASTSTQIMVVSPEENGEIDSMLRQLGMTNGESSSAFIKEYQSTHGLKPTGSIDSTTLKRIINDVTYERAGQLAKQ
jgi:murein L,D-transpeptidase YcbB/YkuD